MPDLFTEQGVIDAILHQMNRAGLSQRELASRLNVTEARVSQMLRVGSNMTLRTVERVFAAITPHQPKGPEA